MSASKSSRRIHRDGDSIRRLEFVGNSLRSQDKSMADRLSDRPVGEPSPCGDGCQPIESDRYFLNVEMRHPCVAMAHFRAARRDCIAASG
jgi:hypothetical protein